MKLKTVGIISKPKKEEICAVAPGLLEWLQQRGLQAVCDQETTQCLGQSGGVPREAIASRVDLIVVLGGDGTLLAAARLLHPHPVPLLAVNLGSLGFLTEITLDEMYAVLEAVLADRHQLDTRRMLDAEVERPDRAITRYSALNDVVLHKAALARIVDFDVSVGGRFVSRIRADGLILATPTGSTAYSLSAGGPIVLPSVEAMVVTPIAPHMLTNRPLVIPGESRVEVQLHSPSEAVYVTVDGQVGEELHSGDCVRVERSDRVVQLIVAPSRDYFQILRSKLRWGER
ncbi:MAG: NAD(+)/NADH kinase [Acidobacteria bacterium]|nr:NAD(+)/NADH kinase [Acidobacteriota bacterium]